MNVVHGGPRLAPTAPVKNLNAHVPPFYYFFGRSDFALRCRADQVVAVSGKRAYHVGKCVMFDIAPIISILKSDSLSCHRWATSTRVDKTLHGRRDPVLVR